MVQPIVTHTIEPRSIDTSSVTESAFHSVSATYATDDLADPHSLYAQLRRTTPVMKGDILALYGIPSQADYANTGRPVFTLFRHADVAAVLRDDKAWSTDLLKDGLGTFLGEMFLSARNGESHRLLRRLLQPCFAPDVTRRWRTHVIAPLVEREYGGQWRARGRAELMSDLAMPFPILAIYAILGFPDDPASVTQFADWALQILNGPQIDPEKAKASMARAFEAADLLDEHVRGVVAARRRAGASGEELIDRLIRTEVDGERLDDGQIAGIVRMLLPAAAETTTRTLANLMVHLLQDERLLARVRRDRSLLPRALTESMRLEPVAGFLARRALRDLDIGGVTIPAGSAVSLVMGSANRDEAMFADADSFDLDRSQQANLGFGYGLHMCIGMPVARTEVEVAADMLLNLPNLRFDPDRPAPRLHGLQFRGPDAVHLRWDTK